MPNKRSSLLFRAMSTTLVLSLSACGGGGGGGAGVVAPSGPGSASFKMTDAPVCAGLQSVFVTVTGIQLNGPSGPFSLTLAQPQLIDLSTLTNGAALPLGSISVPAGTYQQLALILASNTGNNPTQLANYVVTATGATIALTTPSAQQSGYKINGQFTVAPGSATTLTVDFNACRSVVVAGNSGKYILKPVLNLIDDDTSGSITGYLPSVDAGALVMAEDNMGNIIKTTVAVAGASNVAPATFTLGPLPALSTGYSVVIAPPQPAVSTPISPNFIPYVISSVPVVAGSVPTILGSANLPLPIAATVPNDQVYSGSIATSADTLIVAQETLANGNLVSIGEVNGVEESGTDTYSLTVPSDGLYVASYQSSGFQFNQAPTTPITVHIYGSDGGDATASVNGGTITLSGTSDPTFQTDN